MNWPELIQSGGGWGIGLFVAWSVWKGELVLKQTYRDVQERLKTVEDEKNKMATDLSQMQADERRVMQEQIASLRSEIAALRKEA